MAMQIRFLKCGDMTRLSRRLSVRAAIDRGRRALQDVPPAQAGHARVAESEGAGLTWTS
jgi:hypothetical protein